MSLLGLGLQSGGTAGQVLVKVDGTDFNAEWQDNSFANLSGNADDNVSLAAALSAKQDDLGFTPEDSANKNTANGYAGLDGSGKVAAAQLPSYVDDVLEFANFAALPATGETGKIYVALDSDFEYRWSGSAYIQIVASPGSTDAVPEGNTNLYFTATRVLTAVLTGIGFSSATAITATDTILGALGKLQSQITALFKIPAGGSTGQVLAKVDGSDGNTHWITPSGGGGSPGGSTNQLQYNNAGAFGGSSKLTFDGSEVNVNNAGFYLGGGTMDASALLQADSTTQGILVPRMTEADRLAITSPAVGLQVYQTDSGTYGEGLYQYKSSGWVSSSAGVGGSTGQIQFNGGGGFAGSSNFTYDATTKKFYVKSENYDGYVIDAANYSGITLQHGGSSYGYIGAGHSPHIGNEDDLSIISNTNLSFEAPYIFFFGSVNFPNVGRFGPTSGSSFVDYGVGGANIHQGWVYGSSQQYNFTLNNAGNNYTSPQNANDFIISCNQNIGIGNYGADSQNSTYAQFMHTEKSFILNGGGGFYSRVKRNTATRQYLPRLLAITSNNVTKKCY